MAKCKRLFRTISMTLAIILLLQLCPLGYIDLFDIKASAAGSSPNLNGYTPSAPNGSDNTVDAVVPPTFSDISISAASSGIFVKRTSLSADDLQYKDIISGGSTYPALSSANKSFLQEYTGFSDNDFTYFAQKGYSLSDSIAYMTLADRLDMTAAAVDALGLTLEACNAVARQAYAYISTVDQTAISNTLNAKFKEYILDGYSCNQVLYAYSISQVYGGDMEELLDNDATAPEMTDEEHEDVASFSAMFGLNANAVGQYVVGNNITSSNLTNNLNSVHEGVAALTLSPGGTSSSSSFYVSPSKVSAPYSYNYSGTENLSLNSGALTIESVDYILPGRNGMDLVIGRRFDSQDATAYTMDLSIQNISEYRIKIMYQACCVLVEDGVEKEAICKTGEYGYGSYATYEEAMFEVQNFNQRVDEKRYNEEGEEDEENGNIYVEISYFATYLGPQIYGSVVNGGTANEFLTGLYGLGLGWSFMFSAIEKKLDSEILHLANGESYELDWSASSVTHLKDYDRQDMKIERQKKVFNNGSADSWYLLTYQNGQKEFFSSDGKLIGMQDRFGNTIKLVHTTQNGLPCITITDTLNRTIIISGQATDSGHVMTVTLPENVTLTYNVHHLSKLNANEASQPSYYGTATVLASYSDPVGNITQYGYDIQPMGYNPLSRDSYSKINRQFNLTTVTHPTQAQTVYTYEMFLRNLGDEGFMEVYKLVSRHDKFGNNTANAVTYSYDGDMSGSPTYSDPENLPDTYTYSATITESSGKTTTVVFNNEHLNTTTTVKNASGMTLQQTSYTYNSIKLPVRTSVKLYGSAASPLETITAAEYDAKGNMTASWSSYANGDTSNTIYKTTYTYDSRYGLLVTQSYKINSSTAVELVNTLSSDGKSITSAQVEVNGTLTQQTDYTYDSYGNIVSSKAYRSANTSAGYDMIEYTYTNGAYLTQQKYSNVLNALGTGAMGSTGQTTDTIVTSYTYDNLGRMLTSTDGNGNTTSYEYDKVGNIIKVTNPDGTFTTNTYDYVNNTLIVTNEEGAQIKYTYTPLGQDYETIDVYTGKVMVRNEYDAMSRLVKRSEYVNGSVTQYTYDILNRVLSETVKQGEVVLAQTTYAYDNATAAGFTKTTKTVVGDSDAPSIVTTEYLDKHGKLVKSGKFFGGTEYFDTYTYDYVGNLVTMLSAGDAAKSLAHTAKYEYNENGQVTKTYNAANQYTTNTYNARGQLTSSTDYAGTPTTYTYDALGRLLTQTIKIDASSTAKSKYEYDSNGNIIREWKPSNVVGQTSTWEKTEYQYDSRNRLTAAIQYNGSTIASVTKYTYDGVGNMLTMTTGLTSTSATTGGSTTTYTYDRFGNVLTTTDARGKIETNVYSTLGRLDSTTDRNGKIINYGYDAMGRLTGKGAADGTTVLYSYTMTGQTLQEITNTETTVYTYDELGRTTNVSTYDTGIDEAHIITLNANGGEVYPTQIFLHLYSETGQISLPTPTRDDYDFVGWYSGDTLYETGATVSSLEGVTTLTARWTPVLHYLTLDANGGSGVPTQILLNDYYTAGQVELPNPTRDGYSFSGWYHGSTRYVGTVAVSVLLNLGTLTAQWAEEPHTVSLNANGGTVSPTQICVTEYSTTVPLPTPTRTGYTFDGWYNGSTHYPSGSTVAALKQIDTLTAQWSPIEYTVVLNGNGGTKKNPSTTTTFTVEYDEVFTLDDDIFQRSLYLFDGWATAASGGTNYGTTPQLSNLTTTDGATVTLYAQWRRSTGGGGTIPSLPGTGSGTWSLNNTPTSSTTYTYDLNGNRLSMTVEADGADVQNVTYTYDNLNRLATVSEDGILAATYTYNTNGSRASLAYANGNVTTYSYNLANWLTELSNKKGSVVISSYSYGYYASGNQRTETDHEGVVTTYTYDGLGRLTQESSSEGKVYNYTYDANSNRATMVVTNTINDTTITIESVTYTYDANNRLTTEAATLIGSVETTRYTYDHNGNMLSNMVYSSADTVIKSLVYTYDGFNQQASVSANSGTVTAHYTYNGHGIRNSKTLGITTTEFLLDGGAVVGEVQGNGADTYLRGANLISANGNTYYLFNGHGDVVNLSNTSGNSTKTYEYDAFGVEQNIDELDDNPFRYCGEYFDQETGTYYLRARYYDPSTGRFTQEDPHWGSFNSIYGDTPMAINQRQDALGLTYTSYAPQIFAIQQSGNLYAYCVGNPVDFVDPSGAIITPYQLKLILGTVSGAVTSAYAYVVETLSNGEEINFLDLLMQTGLGALFGFLNAAVDDIFIQLAFVAVQIVIEALMTGNLEGAIINGMASAAAVVLGFGIEKSIKHGITNVTNIEEVANAIAGTMTGVSIETVEETVEATVEETVEATVEELEDSSGEEETDNSAGSSSPSTGVAPEEDGIKDEVVSSSGRVDGSSPGNNGGINKDIRRAAMP